MPRSSVVGLDELVNTFRSMSKAAKGESLVSAALAGGEVIKNEAKQNIQDQDLIRTRTLSRSMMTEVEKNQEAYASVVIGTNLEYAPIHEFGGIIQAKSGKYLSIPIGDLSGSPRQYDLHLIKSSNGNLLLLDASGKAQFALKRSVQIPARPYLRPAFDEKKDEARDEVAEALKSILLKAAR